ncbi:MAG: DUF1820 family protein [Acidobacteriota bacterium]
MPEAIRPDTQRLYKVIFASQGEVYELFARSVGQGGLLGFVEIGDLVFGERSQVVVDPSEERLKREFEGVRRFHLPMHAIVRIDEVEKEGVARISESKQGEDGGKVAHFPMPIFPPGGSAED